MPKLSVVIPYYNTPEFIEECVNSVLGQSFQDFDIKLVNDCSESSNIDVLNRLCERSNKITLINNEVNRGPCYSRNTGVRNSGSELILPLDSDNYLLPKALETYVSFISKFSDVFVYSWMKKIGNVNTIQQVPEFDLKRLYGMGNYIDTCGMYRREHWELVGGYDENIIPFEEDWDFWLNMGFHGIKGRVIRQVLFVYRVRNGGITDKMKHEREIKNRERIKIRDKYKHLLPIK